MDNIYIVNAKLKKSLGAFKAPWRKSIALVLIDGAVLYTLAYFRNAEEVNRFNTFLAELQLPSLPDSDEASNAT